MKIIDSIWYRHYTVLIGIVKFVNKDGVIKYKIGAVYGRTWDEDDVRIAESGSEFDPIAGEILLPIK